MKKDDKVFEELILHKAVRDAVTFLDGSKENVNKRFQISFGEACNEFGVDADSEAKTCTYKMYIKVFAAVVEALAQWDFENK